MTSTDGKDAPYLPIYEKIVWHTPTVITSPMRITARTLVWIGQAFLALGLWFCLEVLGPIDFSRDDVETPFEWVLIIALYVFVRAVWWIGTSPELKEDYMLFKPITPTSMEERGKKAEFEEYVLSAYPRSIPMRIYRMVAKYSGQEFSVEPRFYGVAPSAPSLTLSLKVDEDLGTSFLFGYYEGGDLMLFARENFPELGWPKR